jgi:hypothetical protein
VWCEVVDPLRDHILQHPAGEAATDHRGGLRNLPGRFRQAVDPRREHADQGVRDGYGGDVAPRVPAALRLHDVARVDERADHLLEKERVPFGLL